MRTFKALIWLCAYVALSACTAEADPNVIARRQDDGVTIAPTSTSTEIKPTASTSNKPSIVQDATSSESPSGRSTQSARSTAGASNAVSSNSPTSSSAPTSPMVPSSVPSDINDQPQTSLNSTNKADDKQPGALPLPPKITPALSVAGVFLILTGFTYALIGIKNRWIQVFLSSAFLTSLSVTVLLVYVMKPPVSSALQGAYFVAAFMTGLVFGAGSLVFKELTEGLGCLLGGFCLSMWLLALRPGGTIAFTGGKVILIAVFTTAAYALSFSHYTRPYGLIGATSFAGATAAVLGFDCFIKAGLKEFWLYIWHLNDNLFPLDTNTYPITHGIRVELAFIVLLCAMGAMSQMKLWKVVKDRREKKDAMRSEEERERTEMEDTIGRRLEEGHQRERARWEAVYGDKDGSKRNTHTDSGLGTEDIDSLRKASVSVKENEGSNGMPERIQTTGTGPLNNEQGDRVLDHIGEPPKSDQSDVDGLHHAVGIPGDNTPPSTANAGVVPAISGARPADEGPLPLTNSSAEGSLLRAQTEGLSDNEDDATTASVLAGENPNIYTFHSKGSSLAATADDEYGDLDLIGNDQDDPRFAEIKISPEASLLPKIVISPGFESFQPQGDVYAGTKGLSPLAPTSTADESDPEEFHRPVQQMTSKPSHAGSTVTSNRENAGEKETTLVLRAQPGMLESYIDKRQAQDSTLQSNERLSLSGASSVASLTSGALAKVPSQLSHVVLSYRTNEWAKHISTAEEPRCDKPEAIAEGAEEFPAHLVETPAPVDVEMLQQTATSAANILPVPQGLVSSLNPVSMGKLNTSNPSLRSGLSSYDSKAPPENPEICTSRLRIEKGSKTNLSRFASANSAPPPLVTRGSRNSSTPMSGHDLKTSPIDENTAAEFQAPTRCISPLPVAGSTLLAQRDSLLRNKHHSFSTKNPASPTTEMMYLQPPTRSNSRISWVEEAGPRSASRLSLASLNDDDMPLSRRKSLIEQQALSLLPETRLATAKHHEVQPSQRPVAGASAHKRESMLASWRESMRQETSLMTAPRDTVEMRRAEMLVEKRQSKMTRDYSAATKVYQEKALAQAARRGDMQELHREAMRKMQADANKHISY